MADQQSVARKLAAILYADVAGYSRLTGADEEGTHRTVAAYLDAISGLVEGQGRPGRSLRRRRGSCGIPQCRGCNQMRC